MIPLAVPDLTGNEARYLQECIDTGYVSSVGPFVSRFERMVAEATGAPAAVATASGTTALHAALVTVGVQPGDLVILPSFTFIASANAVSHCGASPWLFDVSAESWTLDPEIVADALAREAHRSNGRLIHGPTGRRIAAMLPVYTLGTPADMDVLVAIAREHDLPVVADAAAAAGATYKGRPLGSLGADLTVLSFNGNKTVTAGGGGAAAGSESLVESMRHLTTTARRGPDYDHDRVGYNYRMTNLQAAVGCAQLERLDEFVSRKRIIAETYRRAVSQLPGAGFFPVPVWAGSSCWFSAATVSDPPAAAVIASLRGRGIDARPFWKPVHLQAPYREAPVYNLPRRSEALWPAVVTLPCSTALTAEDQAFVIQGVGEALGVLVRTAP